GGRLGCAVREPSGAAPRRRMPPRSRTKQTTQRASCETERRANPCLLPGSMRPPLFREETTCRRSQIFSKWLTSRRTAAQKPPSVLARWLSGGVIKSRGRVSGAVAAPTAEQDDTRALARSHDRDRHLRGGHPGWRDDGLLDREERGSPARNR